MDLIDTPFDCTTHTVDVRSIGRTQGWHNIRNVGFFLWRLLSNPSIKSDPRSTTANPFGYHFSPFGNPVPLFTKPAPELSETGLAAEIHVPGPIRPLAFHLDRGAYCGQDLSFAIFFKNAAGDPVPVPLAEIVCLDLDEWERPPAGVSGLFSDDLVAFPGLVGAPSLDIAIAGHGPLTVTLAAPFGTLDEARVSLEAAIRGAQLSREFEAVRVIRVGNRLVILPGVRGAAIAFASSAGDPTTISTLGLDAAIIARGLLSGDLTTFPEITKTGSELEISIAGIAHVGSLGMPPVSDLATARARLEAAIRSGPTPSFLTAQVLVVENRLLILPGNDGDTVLIRRTATDPTTAEQLRLTSKVGVDVHRGRFVFPMGDEPKATDLAVSYRYGFSAELGGGAYDRRRGSQPGAPDPEFADTVRFPDAFNVRINVPQDFPDLASAVAAWNPVTNPQMVIQVNDNRSYAGDVVINVPAGQLVVQAANRTKPVLLGNVIVNASRPETRLRIDGFWVEGQLRITGTLGRLEIAHSRFVSGIQLDEQGDPVHRDRPSLVVDPSNDRLYITVDHAIIGTMLVPVGSAELRVTDSVVDTARREGAATLIPALLSGDLTAFAGTTAAAPEILVTIGDTGPIKVATGPMANFNAIATQLQTALTSASIARGFIGARVLPVGNRVLVLSGDHGAVSVQSTASDTTTAAELSLRASDSRSIVALRSGPLPAIIPVTNPAPRVNVTFGAGATTPLDLSPGSKTPAGFQGDLAGLVPAAVVLLDGSSLIILPPGEGDAVVFTAHEQDKTTLTELQLDTARPSIAGSLGGEHPAPKTVLTCSTVLGASHFRELILASEVIFQERTIVDRRQMGCVRFSSITPDSRTPRRFRCQPDLALENIVDPAERTLVRLRLRPTYTSIRSGDPGYAQLALSCACEIKTGAENGAEMGAFNMLMQPQRAANLRFRLEEYLPLGLQPGLIYVT